MKKNLVKRSVSGLLLLDKPHGLSSNLALQKVRRLFHAKKAGHTGSLDPLATGMLPICLGEATKYSQFLLDLKKTYQVKARLGVATLTGDMESDPISVSSVPDYSIAFLDRVLDNFRGHSEQVPSMFSALKHQGQPLYKLARQGKEVARKSRAVYIERLTILSYQDEILTFEVCCSKGTYVRTLVQDLGEQLGCGAHVIHLHRTGVGVFQAQDMVNLSDLQYHYENAGMTALDAYLLPVANTVTHLPRIVLSDVQSQAIVQGKSVNTDAANMSPGMVALMTKDNKFLGVAQLLDEAILKPKRLMIA